MENFEVLEHTADLKIRVWGRDIKELFIQAALAMAEQQKKGITEEKPEEEPEIVEIKSMDKESLLVDWLNEILSRSDLNKKVYFDFKIEQLAENYLKAEIGGRKVEQKEIDIKAATYHNLKIIKEKGIWQAEIIFDI